MSEPMKAVGGFELYREYVDVKGSDLPAWWRLPGHVQDKWIQLATEVNAARVAVERLVCGLARVLAKDTVEYVGARPEELLPEVGGFEKLTLPKVNQRFATTKELVERDGLFSTPRASGAAQWDPGRVEIKIRAHDAKGKGE